MACDVFAGFTAMTESLNPELRSRLKLTDPWMELVERDTYPQNKGYEQTDFTITDVEPETATPNWSPIQPVSDTNPEGPCAINYDTLGWGHDKRTYQPEQYGIQGPVMCKDEFTFDFATSQFIQRYLQRIAQVTRRVGAP